MQVLQIKFPNGERFNIPAGIVAKSRTEHYAESDGFERDSDEWNEEMEQSMEESELRDWLFNNMDWKDVKDHAVKAAPADDAPTYESMWGDADAELLSEEEYKGRPESDPCSICGALWRQCVCCG